MKKIILLICVILMVGCSNSKVNHNYGSLDSRGLKGPVKTITHHVEGEHPEGLLYDHEFSYMPNQTDYYNIHGNIIKSIESNSHNALILLYEYNDFHQNAVWHIGRMGNKDDINSTKDTVYIDDVEILLTVEYDIQEKVKDGFVNSKSFSPNNNENITVGHGIEEYKDYQLIHSKNINSYSRTTTYTDYVYDADGYLSKFSRTDDDGNIFDQVEYVYNDHQVIKYIETDESTKTTVTIDYLEFDEYDNWTKAEFMVDDREIFILNRDFEYYEEE